MRHRDSRDPELGPRAREGRWAEASSRLALRYSIARLVLSARAKRCWSQAELAKRAATTQARVSDIENGRGNLRLDTLERVTDALGLALMVRSRAVPGGQRSAVSAAAAL